MTTTLAVVVCGVWPAAGCSSKGASTGDDAAAESSSNVCATGAAACPDEGGAVNPAESDGSVQVPSHDGGARDPDSGMHGDDAGGGSDAGAGSDAGSSDADSCAERCASGVCNANRECASCVDDVECAEGRVCGTLACGAVCGGKDDPSCGPGTECCGGECVDTRRDVEHCDGCRLACSANEFCGSTGCTTVSLANLCNNDSGAVVLDGRSGDDVACATLRFDIEAGCVPAPTMRSVQQDASDVLNPVTGQPVAGGNDLLVTIGSAYSNHLVKYLEQERIAPVYQHNVGGTTAFFQFRHSGSNVVLASTPVDGESDTHGNFLVELVRDPKSGTLVLVAYGYWAGGSSAAGWFVGNRVLPALSTFTDSWYIYRWTSENADPAPDAADTFTLIASGN